MAPDVASRPGCLAPFHSAAELTVWACFGESAGYPVLSMVEPSEHAVLHATRVTSDVPRSGGAARSSSTAGRDAGQTITAIMDRYAQGEDAAFDELYRLAAPRVRGFLVRLSGDVALSDDLTQETFLRIHRARGGFAPGAAAIPWMLAIARNALRDSARRAQARPQLRANAQHDEEGPVHEAAPDERGDEVLAAREMLEIVERTLAEIPTLHREAFVLLRFEGLSVSEAAAVLGATEGAVKVRAFRAYEALREALGFSRGKSE